MFTNKRITICLDSGPCSSTFHVRLCRREYSMSYDEKTNRINWRDETGWLLISIISGLLLSFLFMYFDRFPKANGIAIIAFCCVGFYFLSILLRAQNHRGKSLTGKTAIKEQYIKYIFPLLGFGIGFAIIFIL